MISHAKISRHRRMFKTLTGLSTVAISLWWCPIFKSASIWYRSSWVSCVSSLIAASLACCF